MGDHPELHVMHMQKHTQNTEHHNNTCFLNLELHIWHNTPGRCLNLSLRKESYQAKSHSKAAASKLRLDLAGLLERMLLSANRRV